MIEALNLENTLESVSNETLIEMRENSVNFPHIIQAVNSELETRIVVSLARDLRNNPSLRTIDQVNHVLNRDYLNLMETELCTNKLKTLQKRLKALISK